LKSAGTLQANTQTATALDKLQRYAEALECIALMDPDDAGYGATAEAKRALKIQRAERLVIES